MTERYVYVRARVVRAQEAVLTVKLEDGFGQLEALVDAKALPPEVQGNFPATDDSTRLPLLLAAAMTKLLKASGLTRLDWLTNTPKETLAYADDRLDALCASVRLHPDRVLEDAAHLALAAMGVADKADKLEPLPELVDPDGELLEP